MLPLLKYNIHRNPQCLLKKSENEEWDRCICVHGEAHAGKEKIFRRTCFAGVEETVFVLGCGGEVCVSVDKDNEIAYEEICTLVSPLCRMLEYLKTFCTENEIEITDNETVSLAVRFIQRNFYNNISVQDVAEHCACSVSSISHLFTSHIGKSIVEYVNMLRISYAKELLQNGGLRITAIAQKCGFSDYNYFSIRFKKETGISPSAYRKQSKARKTENNGA